jgi:hypothetical protein
VCSRRARGPSGSTRSRPSSRSRGLPADRLAECSRAPRPGQSGVVGEARSATGGTAVPGRNDDPLRESDPARSPPTHLRLYHRGQ